MPENEIVPLVAYRGNERINIGNAVIKREEGGYHIYFSARYCKETAALFEHGGINEYSLVGIPPEDLRRYGKTWFQKIDDKGDSLDDFHTR